MILDPNKIPDLIKKRRRNPEIDRCKRHDARAVMHTEAMDVPSDIKYLTNFKAWAGKILSPKKQGVFEHLLTLPLATVDITEGIFNETKKVFDAHNRVIKFEFTNPSLADDFTEYRKKIRDFDFWQTDGFSAMKSAINSFIVVDLPPEQKTDYPEPYFYLLDIENVIDVDVKRGVWRVEYIVFSDPEDQSLVHVFDDAFYRTYQKTDKSAEYVLIKRAPHDLGYCPVRSFWTTPYMGKSKIQKLAPISKSLAALDQLLFAITCKRHLELYAGFPIYQSYEQKCDYIEEETGLACDHGILLMPGGEHPLEHSHAKPKPCPRCAENRQGLGPGSHIIVPARAQQDDPDMINGVNVVGAEIDSLTYNKTEVDDQIAWITYNIIGVAEEMTKEAVNEKQVQSGFESRQTVLMDIKRNFELIHQWTIETVGKLRYGPKFTGATVDWGSQFFLHTTAEIMEAMKTAKEQGLPQYEIANIRQMLVSTKYRNNPDMLKRTLILGQIEPYVGYTIEDLSKLKALTRLDERLVLLKTQFDYYIRRFEREHIDIVSFMQYDDLRNKVDFISAVLMEYVEADLEEIEPEETEMAENGENDDGMPPGTPPKNQPPAE